MRGFQTFQTNHGIGEMAGQKEWFLELHANSFEQAEVLKAIDVASVELRRAYSRTDDPSEKSALISAETTLLGLAKAFRGEQAPF